MKLVIAIIIVLLFFIVSYLIIIFLFLNQFNKYKTLIIKAGPEIEAYQLQWWPSPTI